MTWSIAAHDPNTDAFAGPRSAVNATLPIPDRLLLAMDAGQHSGGDRRGKQSAAMVMVATEDVPDMNLRVDDHPEPLP